MSLKLVTPNGDAKRAGSVQAQNTPNQGLISASSRIDPLSLRLFVAVMDSGTISAAADREHIAPSAVSKRLSDLEYCVRTELIERSNKGIKPTPAGLEMLAMARHVLNDLDNVVLRMRDYSSGTKGRVRIAANLSTITEFLPCELQEFTSQFPEVQIELEECISREVQQRVANNAADVGLYAFADGDASEVFGLEAMPYHQDKLVLLAPEHHPITTENYQDITQAYKYDFVGLHNGSYTNQALIRSAQDSGQSFRCRVQVTSYDALLLMVSAGLGLGVMPEIIAQRYCAVDRLRILPINQAWSARQLKLCVRQGVSLMPAVRKLVDFMASPQIAQAN
jgi:DNA-binding transcriptional LysR family regulator